jgi:hypothetical protein
MNRPVLFIACIAQTSVVACFCETTNVFYQFVQEQSERRYSKVPREVLAVYYGWFMPDSWHVGGTNATGTDGTVRRPLKGLYKSHDPAVIDQQIDEAKAHGITCFVLSWFGMGPEAAIQERSMQMLIEEADKKDFKVSILWEQAPGEGQHRVDRAVAELSYALKTYGRRKAFLKVDGKPVIFIYERVLGKVPMKSWPEITRRTRARAGDFVFIGNGYDSQENGDYLFDGMSSFDFEFMPGHIRADPVKALKEFRQWAREKSKEYVAADRRHDRISCLGIIPGFDNTRSSPPGLRFNPGEGETYRALWEAAVEADPDWVIFSWNEWGEGTEVEPSVELGDKYLRITADYAERFLKTAPVPSKPPILPPRSAPGTDSPADRVLAGRSVGYVGLGRFVDPEFWLLYGGADVVPLTWADLTDSKTFNARALPLVVQVGHEHYQSSVKFTDDVTLGLGRYLHEGGFLAILPVAPWPLLCDDSRKGDVHAITDTLALGITGWDPTNFNAHPKFHVNTNALRGLPGEVAFPTTGDVRWTGATPKRVPPSELYGTLAQLRAEKGPSAGDAIVYIQHRTPSLSSGKTLYVWMRMPELLGKNEFYPSLYRFVTTQLKPLR